MKWIDNHIEVDPPKRPKKITGTRFATIMGLNPWSTPFETWCAITKTYEKPFEDTIYTKAGKTIEPKQARYMKKSYALYGLKTPEDIFGKDYFKATFGDFFKENKHLGGMWDYLVYEDGKPSMVLEMKTTKRIEDWGDDVPEYYALQAALYAYLLGVDDVMMVASFLEAADYEHPENFVPSVQNTIVVPFKVSERYPDFADKVAFAESWWATYVETGISPDFDEKRDADILKELRNNSLSPDTDIVALVEEAEKLKAELDKASAAVADKEKRLKAITDTLKEYAQGQFRDGDKTVNIKGKRYAWTLSRSTSNKFDEKAFSKANAEEYAKYLKSTTTYRMTVGEIKEEK